MAQEALRNVIAHAGASRADVRLVQMGDQAEITIADDGRGSMPPTMVREPTVSGSSACLSARGILGGTVSIVSAPNQGHACRRRFL